MKTNLLDVSVLVALFWAGHPSHGKAREWFMQHAGTGWATCPLTQASFVRVVSNPSFSKSAATVAEAAKLLEENLNHPAHHYWSADIDYFAAVKHFASRIVGHKQVPDAYLLGLAIHHRGNFVTMDRGILQLVPENLQPTGFVILI